MNNFDALSKEIALRISEVQALEAAGDYAGALVPLRKMREFTNGFLESAFNQLSAAARAKYEYERIKAGGY